MSIANIGDEVTDSDYLCFCGLVVSWLLSIAVNPLHHTIAIDSFAEVSKRSLPTACTKLKVRLRICTPYKKKLVKGR